MARIAPPDVGVITRIAVEHLEFFSSIEEIALAERELIENLAWPDATAVLNADDERVERFAEVARGRVLWFGTGSGTRAEFRAENIEERGVSGSAFDFVSPAGRARLELPLDRASQRDERQSRRSQRQASGASRGRRTARVPHSAARGQTRRSGQISGRLYGNQR